MSEHNFSPDFFVDFPHEWDIYIERLSDSQLERLRQNDLDPVLDREIIESGFIEKVDNWFENKIKAPNAKPTIIIESGNAEGRKTDDSSTIGLILNFAAGEAQKQVDDLQTAVLNVLVPIIVNGLGACTAGMIRPQKEIDDGRANSDRIDNTCVQFNKNDGRGRPKHLTDKEIIGIMEKWKIARIQHPISFDEFLRGNPIRGMIKSGDYVYKRAGKLKKKGSLNY